MPEMSLPAGTDMAGAGADAGLCPTWAKHFGLLLASDVLNSPVEF
jgi:hypothetical protein